ncbi:MAG: iron complex outermembrane receptor protein, partial [Colwellia sp.]
MYWRKKLVHSSLIFVSEKLTIEGIEQRKFNSASLALTLVLACAPYAHCAQLNTTYLFNIPQQRAELSLTQFAEQADLTLIFSLDKVSATTANKLTGNYSIEHAIKLLLEGTELVATLSEQGLFSINNKNDLGKTDNMFKKNTLSTA